MLEPSEIEKVYELIVQDLKDAINELPTGYDKEPARLFGVDVWATKQAAQSTLAAVYMSMAGYPLNKGDRKRISSLLSWLRMSSPTMVLMVSS